MRTSGSRIERFADAQLRRLPAAPVVAKVLDLAMEGNQHQMLLTEGLQAVQRFLDDNQEMFRQRVAEESPDWVPDWVDGRVFTKLFAGVQTFLADVAGDPEHALRRQFDERLQVYAGRLRTDPAASAALEQWKTELLDHPAVRGASGLAVAAAEEGGAGGGRRSRTPSCARWPPRCSARPASH